mmetsp:Transcript_19300/g.27919  ORF Transcript_19300/g.27919 Transcript_19300/m.27919 type:complete len:106 (+) Transcript_19300:1151-1468(+)
MRGHINNPVQGRTLLRNDEEPGLFTALISTLFSDTEDWESSSLSNFDPGTALFTSSVLLPMALVKESCFSSFTQSALVFSDGAIVTIGNLLWEGVFGGRCKQGIP